MGAVIIAVVIIIIFGLFLLSVFGPMHSEKKFWVAIRKIRSVMDFSSYWFYNLCGIAVILFIVVMAIYGLINL